MSRLFVAVALAWVCSGVFSFSIAQVTQPDTDVSLESAGPVFRAFGDASAIEDDKSIRSALDTLAMAMNLHPEFVEPDAQPAQAPSPLSPEVRKMIEQSFDQGIAEVQKQLDQTAKDDSENRKSLEEALATLKQQRAESLGEVPASPAPVAAGEKQLKRPVKRTDALTLDQALADLRQVLRDNAEPAALAAFAASPDYQSAGRAAKAAAAGLFDGRPMAGLAGLLRAHELAPDDPNHLANLAGLANQMAFPRQAIALLAAAEALPPPETAFGLDMRAVILTNRGHALIQLRKPAEAEQALRQAVVIDPTFAEARANLAQALWQQGNPKKKDEAVRFARVARKRAQILKIEQAVAEAPPAQPDGKGEFTMAKLQQVALAGRQGRPLSAASVFPIRAGKTANMPTLKIPRRIPDGAELYPKIKSFREELMGRMSGLSDQMNDLNDRIRARARAGKVHPAVDQRARDLMNYIAHPEWEPSLMAAYMDQYKAGTQINIGTYGGQVTNPWADKDLMKQHDMLWPAKMPEDQKRLAFHNCTEPVHGKWQGPIHNYATSLGQWLKVKYRYQTGLAANIGDPLWHAYAKALIEFQAISTALDLVSPLEAVCNYDHHFVSLHGQGPGGKGEAEAPVAGETPPPDICGPALRGEYTASVSVGFVEVGGNCESIYVQLSAGEWVKGFSKFTYGFTNGDVTIFVGGAGEAGLPGTTVKSAVRTGAYVTISGKGEFVDAGFKMTRASSVGIDVVVGSVGYEREIESPFSVVAAFAN